MGNRKGSSVEYVVTKDNDAKLSKQEMKDEAKKAAGKLHEDKPGGVTVLRIRGASKNC
jgi:hypothetical protein